jgi:methyl-accepting chemotaxis protein
MTMPKLLQLGIAARLFLSYLILLIVMAAMSGIALWRLKAVNDMADYLVNDQLVKQQIAADWLGAVNQNATRALAIAKSDSLEVGDYFQAQLDVGEKAIAAEQNKMQGVPKSADESTMLDAIDQQRGLYVGVRNQVFKLKASGQTMEVEKLVGGAMETSFATYRKTIHTLLDYEKEQAKRIAVEAARVYSNSRWITLGLGALALIVGGTMAWLLTYSIVQPLRQAVDMASRVANGDLSTQIQVSQADEIGQLVAALQRMNVNLADTVGKVQQGIENIDTASREIVMGNNDLSARTEAQVSALQETVTAIADLAKVVKQNDDSARHAKELSHSAAKFADRGNDDIQRVVAIMTAIKNSSGKIVDIISVIDGIAFQTNILALNAAVEAARAGQEGRGFAVVAAEVRTLAQRSATAAKEIKDLIHETVKQVNDGAGYVDAAGSTMNEITTSSRQVAGIVEEISNSSQTQSADLQLVNHTIGELETTSQKNATLVEQASSAADSLQEQSQLLGTAIAFFRLTKE